MMIATIHKNSINNDKVYTGKSFNHIQNLIIRYVGIVEYITAVIRNIIPQPIPLNAIFSTLDCYFRLNALLFLFIIFIMI